MSQRRRAVDERLLRPGDRRRPGAVDDVNPREARVRELQRTAGNRAVTSLLSGTGVAVQREGGSSSTATPRPRQAKYNHTMTQLAILVLQGIQRGAPVGPESVDPRYQDALAMVQQSILRSLKAVLYWNANGCIHKIGDQFEIVRPAPALAIAGWIPNLYPPPPGLVGGTGLEALAPRDPDFFPTPRAAGLSNSAVAGASAGGPAGAPAKGPDATDPDSAMKQARVPPIPKPKNDELQTDEALRVATFMLTQRASGNPFLASGLAGGEQQALGRSLLSHFLAYGAKLEDLQSYGVAHHDQQRMEWVRPAPPEVVAMLLGIGPPDNPRVKGWDGH